ncbi:MAG: hypothetical protein PVH42_09235, partial [Desulfobacterales bacterium]
MFSFKVFHELMAKKVTDILLISSPYEAFIMEEEGRLAERIMHEYRGLNLSLPPMLTWVSTASEALKALFVERFLRCPFSQEWGNGQQSRFHIPVKWHDISGVAAIIETALENFKADP